MSPGIPKLAFGVLAVAFGWVFVAKSGAAEPGAVRGAPPPASPAVSVRPTEPVAPRTGKPDYAIGLASQQELENTALQWRFRIDNKGNAAPVGEATNISTPSGKVPTLLPGATAARLVVSVGNPCPEPKTWIPFAEAKVGVLKPGASTVVPAAPIQMPGASVGKGCRFRAEIVGPHEDANPANNVMHMITKTASLPDLVVVFGPDAGGPGGNLDVRNDGQAPAGPSRFHFDCTTKDQSKNCGKPSDPWKPALSLDVQVPALKPGQRFPVKGSTPKGAGVSWKAYADHGQQVVEGNEANNVRTGGN